MMASPNTNSENAIEDEKSNFVESVYKPSTSRTNSVLELEDNSNKDTWFLYLAVFVVNLPCFVSGISLGWTSPVISKFNGPENPFNHPVTTTQQAWIAALLGLGATIGPFTAGYCGDKWGRKRALLFLATPMLIAYFVLSFASTVYWYYIARFLVGVGVGSTYGMVPAYLGEITESHNRGKFGVAVGVFITFGLFYPFVIGPHLSLSYYNLICTVPILVFLICFGMFIPESPYYLASIGDIENAMKALTKLRRKSYKDLQKELAEIMNAVKQDRQNQGAIKDLFNNVALKRSLIMGLGIVIMAQLDGISAVVEFLKPIFEATGTTIDPNVCTTIIGCIQVASNGAAIFFVDKIDRKRILQISSVGCLISMFGLGMYFYLKVHNYDVTDVFWLPIACLIVYIIFYSIGLGPVVIAISGEIYPSHVKGTAAALTASAIFLTASVVSFTYPIMSESIGMAESFWLFACFCILTILFVHFVLIETKGKTLAEIQEELKTRYRSKADSS